MNNRKNLIVAAIAIVALGATLLIGCKKENADAGLNQKMPTKEFTPPQVDDMSAYLKDFKQKMQAATRDEEETFTLEEAAWYLSSVANYDYGYVNVEFDDIRFDTIYAQINVTNKTVLLSDLGASYEKISSDIEKFFQCLSLTDPHFRFIGASIAEDGLATITLATTFRKASRGWDDYHWYFLPHVVDPYNDSVYYADSICDAYFSDNLTYIWNGTGNTELVRLLNQTESHIFSYPGVFNSKVFFTYTREKTFYYIRNIDPYGSPNDINSRLFGVGGAFNYEIPKQDMCYYLDSYLGLGYQYLVDHPNSSYQNECPALWSVSCNDSVFDHDYFLTYYHNLHVTYCQSTASEELGPQY